MTHLEVRELRNDELPLWDALVTDSDQGTVFHTSDWLLKNASLLNQTPVFLGCYEDEILVGGCPIILSKRFSFFD